MKSLIVPLYLILLVILTFWVFPKPGKKSEAAELTTRQITSCIKFKRLNGQFNIRKMLDECERGVL